MTDTIYTLNITIGVDDYKTRGESPESTITLHKTREDANEYLKNYLRNDMVLRKNDYETEYRLDYVEKSGFKNLFMLIESGESYEFNENSELHIDDIDMIHQSFCKGEFIPYRWTYSIEEHKNPRNQ
jgi:hypothetical protein